MALSLAHYSYNEKGGGETYICKRHLLWDLSLGQRMMRFFEGDQAEFLFSTSVLFHSAAHTLCVPFRQSRHLQTDVHSVFIV
jgi:hypothetical protein